jgi:hypothetical protein
MNSVQAQETCSNLREVLFLKIQTHHTTKGGTLRFQSIRLNFERNLTGEAHVRSWTSIVA